MIDTALLGEAARTRLKQNFDLPPRPPGADESVADFFRRQFGPDTVSLVAEPLLAGIHAGDVERLSMHAVAPRLVQLEAEYGGVLNAFRDRAAPASDDGPFRSLRGGMGELVTALLDALPDGSTWPSSGVTEISRSGSDWTVTTSSNAFTASARRHGRARACGREDAVERGARAGVGVRRRAVRVDRERGARLAPRARSRFTVRHRLRRRAATQRAPDHRRVPGSRPSGPDAHLTRWC